MHVYGLIGYPLEHSFSKKYFTEKFRKENINARFDLFSLSSLESFPELISQKADLKGLAVTIPHKVTVIPFLDRLTEQAFEVGAVNCIEFSHGKLVGHNTDSIGFQNSLQSLISVQHKGALVLGTGGAAKAVQFVLATMRLPYLVVTRSTSPDRGFIRYEDITREVLSKFSVIINCTPVGMYPNENDKPALPYHLLSPQNILYDLIYNPEVTSFLREGIAKGCLIKNGLEMLELQAEENWKIWAKH